MASLTLTSVAYINESIALIPSWELKTPNWWAVVKKSIASIDSDVVSLNNNCLMVFNDFSIVRK